MPWSRCFFCSTFQPASAARRAVAALTRAGVAAQTVSGERGFAVTVAEAWQGLGLARGLLAKLICHAGGSGVARLRDALKALGAPDIDEAPRGQLALFGDPG